MPWAGPGEWADEAWRKGEAGELPCDAPREWAGGVCGAGDVGEVSWVGPGATDKSSKNSRSVALLLAD